MLLLNSKALVCSSPQVSTHIRARSHIVVEFLGVGWAIFSESLPVPLFRVHRRPVAHPCRLRAVYLSMDWSHPREHAQYPFDPSTQVQLLDSHYWDVLCPVSVHALTFVRDDVETLAWWLLFSSPLLPLLVGFAGWYTI